MIQEPSDAAGSADARPDSAQPGAYGPHGSAGPYGGTAGPYGPAGSYGHTGPYDPAGAYQTPETSPDATASGGYTGTYPPGDPYAPGGAYGYGPGHPYSGYYPGGAYGPGYGQAYGPGGPGGPYGPMPTAPGSGGRGRRHHVKLMAVTAVVALAAGAGSAFALTGGGGSSALTTSQVVAKTDPGIVDVVSTLGDEGATSSGTGIVLTSTGEILTNNHVIDGATSIKVRDVGTGKVYTAKVVGYSETRDIAVLQLVGASGLTTAVLGNSSTVRVGDKVVAIGNAEGKDGTPSVATGKVTALNQAITATDDGGGDPEHLTGLIETNAAIEPGDSGGPLTSTSGQIIGMDTAAQTGSLQLSSSMTTATKAYTIPINEALSLAKQIEAGKSSAAVHIGATAFLGVEVSASSSAAGGGEFPGEQQGGTTGGALIEGVQQGSPVASAGLAGGDTITAIGSHKVTSANQLRTVLTPYHPGNRVSITWTDESGASHTASIVMGSGPAG